MKNNGKMIGALALCASTLIAPSALAAGAKVCFEAENPATMQKPLIRKLGSSNRPYSGKGYLENSVGQEQNQRHRAGGLQNPRRAGRRLFAVGAHFLGERLRQLGRGFGQWRHAKSARRRRNLR